MYKKQFIFYAIVFFVISLLGTSILYKDVSTIKNTMLGYNKKKNINQKNEVHIATKDVLAATSTTLYAIEDSYVKNSNPSTNYGSSSVLFVDNYDSDSYAYLKFDLTPLAGITITSARFNMRLDSSSEMLGGYLRSVSDTSWKESTITWNNKPALGSTIVGIFNADQNWITDPNWVAGLDITSYVNSKKGGLASLGIAMSSSYNSSTYKSSETTDKPNIVVTYQGSLATPTPTLPPPTPTKSPTPTPTRIPTPTPTPTPGLYSVAGNLYIDANKNGIKELGESNYIGTPTITADRGTVILNSDGSYRISNLTQGSVTISLIPPSGYNMTYPQLGPPPSFQITVGPGCNTNGISGAICN